MLVNNILLSYLNKQGGKITSYCVGNCDMDFCFESFIPPTYKKGKLEGIFILKIQQGIFLCISDNHFNPPNSIVGLRYKLVENGIKL